VVVDGIEAATTAEIGVNEWDALLGGLGHLPNTTAVSICPVSGQHVGVDIRRTGGRSHRHATSANVARLLRDMHALIDAATLYVGSGVHASELEPRLGQRDLALTTWRSCSHDQAACLSDLDRALPIVEMLFVLRRGSEPLVPRPAFDVGRPSPWALTGPRS
jgi:hypothetical protein